MEELNWSEAAIVLPVGCFANAGDSFLKIFKKQKGCCDCCHTKNPVKNPIKYSIKRTTETVGFTVLGCVFLVPAVIGIVCYIPEKLVNHYNFKKLYG